MKSHSLNTRHEHLLSEYTDARIAQGYNRGQGDATPIACREFLNFLEAQGCSDVLLSTHEDYSKFCHYLCGRTKTRGKGFISKAYIQHFRYSVHSFYGYLNDAGHLSDLPVTRQLFFHVKTVSKEVITRKEISKLFSSCNTITEKAILALAYGCGLRRSEICRLTIGDYKPNLSIVIVRCGKFYKSRIVPVAKHMNIILKDYLINTRSQLRGGLNCEIFLLKQFDKPFDGSAIYYALGRIVRRARLNRNHKRRITLHMLRNTVAVHMLNKGADIDFVRRFLGHDLIDTTMLYSKRRRSRFSLKRRMP